MAQTLDLEIREQLDRLTPEQQRQVLEFARRLKMIEPHGVPGGDLLRFAGVIKADDLDVMQRTVEEECRQIDANDW